MTKPRLYTLLLCTLALALPGIATAYDADLATRLHEGLTGKMDRQNLAEAPPKIDAPELVKALAKGEGPVLLDIRTPAEHAMVALSHPRALWIPLDELFKPENLDRLPADTPVAVVCLSGYRAAFATALLRAVGFEDAVFVKGGLAGLVKELKPSVLGPVKSR
ncbi:MAG: rhodanese-like domain-containing protein [Gammaproteobacteria bacterium]|nr:rhodanese-like domain-containing protein [Gammaproteobacteria bacterium]